MLTVIFSRMKSRFELYLVLRSLGGGVVDSFKEALTYD